MTIKSLYGAFDSIGSESGAGHVTRHELDALASFTDVVAVIGKEDIRPLLAKAGLPEHPFPVDFLTDEIVGELLKTHKVDIAHFYAGAFTKTCRTLKQHGAKVVYTVAAHVRDESIAEFEKVTRQKYPFAHVQDPQLWQMNIAGYRAADLIICPSTASAKEMGKWGCPNTTVIPHGANLPQQIKAIPKYFSVGYLGQTGPDKGIIYLLRAWSMLNYDDALLRVAGNATENLYHSWRSAGGGCAHMMGWVDHISELYNPISVYVQPSVTEGFGIEVLEAMAYARPVIVSKGAGAADLVTDGVDGFVVPPRDAEAIARRIDELKNNRDKLVSMGAAARAKAEGFTWDLIRKRYVEVWKSLL